MALGFSRDIEREIVVRSSDPGIEDATFILTIGEKGVTMRRKGESESWHLSWRQILGHAFIHARGTKL